VALCVAIVAGFVAGVVDYVTSETVELRRTFAPWMYHNRARSYAEAQPDLEKARAVAAGCWQGQTNPYDGREVREEPSPGNYVIELRDGKIKYVRYDRFGTPEGLDDW
jgi:hypothetical protein